MAGGILIFAPNWLGDAVMALPAIDAVRRGRPDAPLTIAARPAVAPLFDLTGGCAVLRLERSATAAAALRTGGYEAALLLPNSFNIARLAWRAGIPERWGYATDFRSWLLTRAVPARPRLHQVESYRHLVRSLGFADAAPEPRIDLTDSVREEGRARLMAEGWDGRQPLVAMAPGAAFGTAKRWPPAYFADLVDRYAARGVTSVLVGSAGDMAAGREVTAARRIPSRTPASSPGMIDLIGRSDLRLLAAVLAHSRVLVTNDSGAMHFAAALGVNVTAMFGPTIETETHPVGRAQAAVITSSVWCRPCMLRECPLTHRCMREISVDRVFASTEAHV
jgi:heptosyltransferase-2